MVYLSLIDNKELADISTLGVPDSPLQVVDVSGCVLLWDFSALSRCPRLRVFRAQRCPRVVGECLPAALSMECIDVRGTAVSEVGSLSDCSHLTEIYCAFSKMSSLAGLARLEYLQVVDCAGCGELADASPLWSKRQLKWVDFSQCFALNGASVWPVATRVWAAGGQLIFPTLGALSAALHAKKAPARVRSQAVTRARFSVVEKLRREIQGADVDQLAETEAVARDFGCSKDDIEMLSSHRARLLLHIFQTEQPALAATLARWAGPSPAARWKRQMAKLKWLVCRHGEELTESRFVAAVKQLGFGPDVAQSLFSSLDIERKGWITPDDLVALRTYGGVATAQEMAAFRRFLLARFPSLADAFEALDGDQSGEIDSNEFVQGCMDLGFHGNSRGIFVCLDSVQRDGVISLEEFVGLDLFSSVYALEVVEKLRDHLVASFGSLRTAFRRMDARGMGAMYKKDFGVALVRVGFQCSQADLDICWRFFDESCVGAVTVADLMAVEQFSSTKFLADLHNLREFLQCKFGSLSAAFDAMDVQGAADEERESHKWKMNASEPDRLLDFEEFSFGITVGCGWSGEVDIRMLFNFLDETHEGMLSVDEWMKLAAFSEDASKPHLLQLRNKLLERFGDLDSALPKLKGLSLAHSDDH
mmetsp:Transcript_2770/g.6365  ORF Transcript_2770/g.6365 Transcript_2770/m.6365 type:complete len:647 (+) Transcript_2770:819-2759(+)